MSELVNKQTLPGVYVRRGYAEISVLYRHTPANKVHHLPAMCHVKIMQ